MASLRKGRCYTKKITRAFTRKSKVKAKSYIKTIPANRIVRYEMGDPKGKYEYQISLVAKDKCQMRHNSIESVRQIVNRRLNERIGLKNYFMKLRVYPHHILRENKMISGAHADRLQTGMQRAYGKSMGLAAQIKPKKVIFSVDVNDKAYVDFAIEAVKLAHSRLPGKYNVEVKKL